METLPKLHQESKRGLVIMFGMLLGSLALSLAANRLITEPGDCIARQDGGIVDVNWTECINDIAGTELG